MRMKFWMHIHVLSWLLTETASCAAPLRSACSNLACGMGQLLRLCPTLALQGAQHPCHFLHPTRGSTLVKLAIICP